MKKIIFLIGFFAVCSSLPADIVINEIMYNPSPITDAAGEYIEFYNSGTSAVNLIGYFSEAITYYQESNYVLKAGGYAVVAKNPEALVASNQFATNVIGKFTGSLGNGGETVNLNDASSNLADTVTYDDSSPWPTEADGHGPSLELVDPALDNDSYASWLASTNGPPNGTPGYQNSVFGSFSSSKIVINEIMYNPPGAEEEYEYIELYNSGDSPVELLGFYFSAGIDYTQLTAYTILTGDFAVVAMYTNPVIGFHIDCDPTKFIGQFTSNKWGTNGYNGLNNSGELIELRDGSGKPVDSVVYDSVFPWPTKAGGDGPSLELRLPSLDNNNPYSWLASKGFGTPTLINSVYGDDPTDQDFVFVDDDTYVTAQFPTNAQYLRWYLNVESDDMFSETGGTSYAARTWLKFDSGNIKDYYDDIFGPGAWSIDEVKLFLNESEYAPYTTSGLVNVYYIPDDSWLQSKLVWTNEFAYTNNQQLAGSFLGEGTFATQAVQLSLLSPLITDIESGSDVSFRLYAPNSNTFISLISKNNNTYPDDKARLKVNAVPEPMIFWIFNFGFWIYFFYKFVFISKK